MKIYEDRITKRGIQVCTVEVDSSEPDAISLTSSGTTVSFHYESIPSLVRMLRLAGYKAEAAHTSLTKIVQADFAEPAQS